MTTSLQQHLNEDQTQDSVQGIVCEAKNVCPICHTLITVEENDLGELHTDDNGKEICLECYHIRFLARFKLNLTGWNNFSVLPDLLSAEK